MPRVFTLRRFGGAEVEGGLDHPFQPSQAFTQLNLPIPQRGDLLSLRGELCCEAPVELGNALPKLLSLPKDQPGERNGHCEDGNEFRTHDRAIYVCE